MMKRRKGLISLNRFLLFCRTCSGKVEKSFLNSSDSALELLLNAC